MSIRKNPYVSQSRSRRLKTSNGDVLHMESDQMDSDYEKESGNNIEIDCDDRDDQTQFRNSRTDKKNKKACSVTTRKIAKRKNSNDSVDSTDENKKNELVDLPCRDTEQRQIYDYIKKGLDTKGSYTSLYISGMPGTGKTASVNATIQKLRQEAKKNKVPPFETFYINAMKMTKFYNFYKILHDYIFSNQTNKNFQKCCSILDDFFKNRNNYSNYYFNNNQLNIQNCHIVLVIDEIDCLVDKKQNVLYNIFNWTSYPDSRLIIISISNTLDLPERLIPKINSRIGNNRLSFKPYVKEELLKILSIKISNYNQFSNDALKYCSTKVASVTGDIRRILQICKRAQEIHEMENLKSDQIMMNHVKKACEDLYDSKVIYVLKSLKIYEKIVLIAILHELKKSMNSKCSIMSIYTQQVNLCRQIAKSPLNFEELRYIIYNLVKLKILHLTEINNENFITNSICIKFYPDEFIEAMNNVDELNSLIDIFS